MTDPTTQDVKRAYAWGLSGTSRTTQECDDEFDRWLNEIRAEAWDEGFTEGVNDVYLHEDTSWAEPCIPNPYRNSAK